MIEVVTPGAIAQLPVPAGFGWNAGSGTYRYANRLAPAGPSPVRTLTLRQGRVLKVNAKDLSLSLAAPLGSVGIRVTMGSTRTCAFFGGASIVSDQSGSFVARNAAVGGLTDCSDYSLGLAPVCGNDLLEPGETCDGAATGACPGACEADCTCEPYCGDGALDTGEECDGTVFGSSTLNQACTYLEGLATPACQDDCSCCALGVCSAFGFDAACCPGTYCPPRIGPNSISFCTPTPPSCSQPEDCPPGSFCFVDMTCRTPNCSTNEECSPGVCILGICCINIPGFGFICP